MTQDQEPVNGRGSRTVLEPAPTHHHKEITMHPHRSHIITALAAVFAVGLAEAPVFAQGASARGSTPWTCCSKPSPARWRGACR